MVLLFFEWYTKPHPEVRLSIDDGEPIVLFRVEQNAEEFENVVDELLHQYLWSENTMEVDANFKSLHQSLELEDLEEDLEEDVRDDD